MAGTFSREEKSPGVEEAQQTERRRYLWPPVTQEGDPQEELFIILRDGIAALGINVSGNIVIKPIREWHRLASTPEPAKGVEPTAWRIPVPFGSTFGKDGWHYTSDPAVIEGMDGVEALFAAPPAPAKAGGEGELQASLATMLDGQKSMSRAPLSGGYLVSLVWPQIEAALTSARVSGEAAGEAKERDRAEAEIARLKGALEYCKSRMLGHPMWDDEIAGPCRALQAIEAALSPAGNPRPSRQDEGAGR